MLNLQPPPETASGSHRMPFVSPDINILAAWISGGLDPRNLGNFAARLKQRNVQKQAILLLSSRCEDHTWQNEIAIGASDKTLPAT
jgi:hypothetical protein